MRWRFLAAVALTTAKFSLSALVPALSSTAPANAVTVFDNLRSGDGQSANATLAGGMLTARALLFDAVVGGTLETIDIRLSTQTRSLEEGERTISLTLNEGGQNRPGTFLGTTSATQFYGNNLVTTVSFDFTDQGVTLAMGTRYWIVVQLVEGNNIAWQGGRTNEDSLRGQRIGSSWQVFDNFPHGARIEVAAVPIPATGALLAAGLVAVGSAPDRGSSQGLRGGLRFLIILGEVPSANLLQPPPTSLKRDSERWVGAQISR
ncbi:MAG: choice-of-anchor R domain-containing protein [Pseudomonadota bacterium]